MVKNKYKYSAYSSHIYPCSDKHCGFIGSLNAFSGGECYDPCPQCGKDRKRRNGRFVYKQEHLFSWLPFVKIYKLSHVEWVN